MSELYIKDIDNKISDILSLYIEQGDTNYFGEKVTKTEHMIQCAVIAEKNKEPDYIILACLLHDIGHFLDKDDMNGLGVSNHGIIASNYLKKLGMNSRICFLVEKHIDAKRYLVTIDKKNYDKLSDASKKTLEFQGGKMTDEELYKFENSEEFLNILKIRNYDDNGKQINKDLPNIETFKQLIKKYLK
jgi:predicted HD phosphohydrolase